MASTVLLSASKLVTYSTFILVSFSQLIIIKCSSGFYTIEGLNLILININFEKDVSTQKLETSSVPQSLTTICKVLGNTEVFSITKKLIQQF